MTDLRTGLLALRELGPAALFPYAAYRLGLSTGWIERRTPARLWSDRPLERWLRPGIPSDPVGFAAFRASAVGPRFFFDASTGGLPWPAKEGPPADVVREADEIMAGRFRLFGGAPVDLGFPPDWFAYPPPLSGQPRAEARRHWSRVRLDEEGADPRLLWEPARFGWVFPLARAYRWTGDAKYAEGCWGLIDDWRRANPPNLGVHWASAQEAGLRILALAFAERAFFPDWSRRDGQLGGVVEMVAVHAARIPPTLDYARAQNNNHLLSEAAGLLTAGLLFPELRESGRWQSLGRRLLEDGFVRQVFVDGGYIQHSATYQRLALALGVWAARLAEVNDDPLSDATRQALGRLARSVAAQVDRETGRTPSFGPDDGSNILPLSSGEARDARPFVAAAARLFLGETWYPEGPWDETSAWLALGHGARTEAPQPESLPDTGLSFLRGRDTRGSLRCVEFHERPGHSDQLHVDLWWGADPFALDPGSYLYNGPAPWQDGLAGSSVHNTAMVDGLEPMRRAGRFLWAERAQGRLTGRWHADHVQVVRGEHDGYRRLGVTLSRTVALVDGRAWLVEDEARGAGRRRLTVGWNLPDVEWEWTARELQLRMAAGMLRIGWDHVGTRAGMARGGMWVAGEEMAGPVALWGWRSPRYSAIEPCLRLVIEAAGECPLRLRTRFSPGGEWSAAMSALWENRHELQRRPATDERAG